MGVLIPIFGTICVGIDTLETLILLFLSAMDLGFSQILASHFLKALLYEQPQSSQESK